MVGRPDNRLDQRFALALKAGRLGSWSWDLATGRVEWDAHTAQLFGLEPAGFAGSFDAWLAILHPDDREWMADEIERAVADRRPFRFDHRCIWPDGSVHWLEGVGELVVDETGEVVGATGVTLDVDQRHEVANERETMLDAERASRQFAERITGALARLQDITVAFSAAATPDEIGAVLTDVGIAAVDGRSAFLATLDSIEGVLVMRAIEGYPHEYIDPLLTMPLDSDIPAAYVARTRERVIIQCAEDWTRRFPMLEPTHDDAFVIVPLLVEDAVEGVMGLGFGAARTFSDDDLSYLDAIASACAQALHRARLLEAARAAHDESERARVLAERLQTISAGLARAATRTDIGRVVIDQVVPAMQARAGGISELDESGERLTFIAYSGTGARSEPSFPFVTLDEAVLSRDVLQSGKPVYIDGPDQFARRYPELASLQTIGGFGAVATLPLLVDDRPVGSLAIVFDEAHEFVPTERQYLEIVAGLSAQALRRAQALEREQLLAQRLARLQDISDLALARLPIEDLLAELPDRIVALLDCDTSRILLLDERGQELVERGTSGFEPVDEPLRVPVGRGFAGRIAKLGEPVVLDDLTQTERIGEALRSGIRSAAGVPLQAETLLGVLDIGTHEPRHFTDADVELLRLAADRIARAIERGRLFALERDARERSEFLERMHAVLSHSLEIPDLMRRVVQAAVPRLGDWCQLAVFTDETATVPTIEVAHIDPEKLAWAHRARDRFPYDPDALTGMPLAIRTGTTQYYPEINADLIALATPSRQLREILTRLGVRSAIMVPLRGRSGILGALQLVHSESGRRYSAADVQLAEEVAARIAIALDNARMYERERTVAATLQHSLLPPHLPDVPGLEIGMRYWTASDTGAVGGDFYDVMTVGPDQWGVLVGDVSGKGISAAALTGVARQTARAAARHTAPPTEVLAWLDDAVRDQADQFGGQYCTAVYGVLEQRNPWRFRFALGGHPRPVLVPAAGKPRLVGTPGSVLGLLDEPAFHESEITLGPGDLLLLYTDGVTDVPGPSALDDDALLELLADNVRAGAELTVAALYDALEVRHAGVARRDDTALLALYVPDAVTRVLPPAQIRLPARVSSPARARRFVRDTLEPLAVPSSAIDDVELVATELVTNSVMHARSDVTLTIEPSERSVRLRVEDASSVRPVVRRAGPDAATGRGLFIVEQMASQWGVDMLRDGKVVWVDLPL